MKINLIKKSLTVSAFKGPILFFLLYCGQAFCATFYWVQPTSLWGHRWADAGSWSNTFGGTGGAGVPGSNDIAYFDSASGNGVCIIDTFIHVDGIVIDHYTAQIYSPNAYANDSIIIGASGYFQNAGYFSPYATSYWDLNGDMVLVGGTLTLYFTKLYLSQKWLHTGGTFDPVNSTVIFDGAFNSGKCKLQINDSLETFFNLTIDLQSGSVGLFGNLDKIVILNDLKLLHGSILPWTIGNLATLEMKNNLTIKSTFSNIISTIDMIFSGNGYSTVDLTGATGKINGNVTVDKTNYLYLASDMVMDSVGELYLNGGYFDISNYTLSNSIGTKCTGSAAIFGSGVFDTYKWIQTSSSAYFYMYGSLEFIVGAGDFNMSNGTFDGSNSSVHMDINGHFILAGGSFNMQYMTMNLSKNWLHTGGTFNAGQGTVIFDGTFTSPSGKIQMVDNLETFYNLTFQLGGGTQCHYAAGDNIRVLGLLYFNTGSVAPYSANNTCSFESRGDFTVSNSFTKIASNIAIIFSGTNEQYLNLNSKVGIINGNITFNKASNYVTFQTNLTMDSIGILTFTSGAMLLYGYTFTNSTTVAICNGTFYSSNAGNCYFYGWSQTDTAAHFYNTSAYMEIGAGQYTQTNGSFYSDWGNLQINDNFNLSGGWFTLNTATLTLSKNWLHTAGTFVPNTSTVVFNGSFTSPNGKIQMVNHSETFKNLSINLAAGTICPYNNTDKLIINGTLFLNGGSITPWTSGHSITVETKGDINIYNTFGTLSADVNFMFTGSNSQIFDATNATSVINGNITINKNANYVILYSDIEMNASGILTLTSGNLYLYSSYTITNTAMNTICDGTFVITGSGTLDTYGWEQTDTGAHVTLDQSVTLITRAGDFNLNAGTFNLENATINLKNDWNHSGGIFYCGTGTVIINGNTNQTINPINNLKNLTINNSSTLTQASNLNVTGVLDFTSGIILLGNYNLSMGASGSVSGSSPSSFANTGGTGMFKWVSCAASNTKLFPVGHTNSSNGYTPITLAFNGGHTTDDFSVIAIDKITDDGTRTGTCYTNTVVKTMWNITETTPGGTDVDMIFQWNATDEGSGFSRSSCQMAHYSGSIWNNQGSLTSASGSDPYTFTYSNYTGSFSPFGIGGNGGPLPVKLIFFNARQDNAKGLLNWATASEINNDYFEVQKSLDGHVFTSIGQVKGHGNSQQINHYQFEDLDLKQGVNYYRLKQIDFNSNYTFSSVETINFKGQNLEQMLVISPNPASCQINLTLLNNQSAPMDLNIINAMGIEVKKIGANQWLSSKKISISVNDLPSGTYFILYKSLNMQSQPLRFIILR